MDLGTRLYGTVREYAATGAHHRTGTPEDARTLDWFEDRVRALGGTTERQAWSFERYAAQWRVTQLQAGWQDTYVFFKHEESGIGPEFATQFRALLT